MRFELDRGFVLSEASNKRWRVLARPGDGGEVPFGQVEVSIATAQDEWLKHARFDRIARTADPEDVPGAIVQLVREADRVRAAHEAAWEAGWRP